MSNDKETQKMLRLFNKLNKLFIRENISPLESIPPLLIAAMEAALIEHLTKREFAIVLWDIYKRFKARRQENVKN